MQPTVFVCIYFGRGITQRAFFFTYFEGEMIFRGGGLGF